MNDTGHKSRKQSMNNFVSVKEGCSAFGRPPRGSRFLNISRYSGESMATTVPHNRPSFDEDGSRPLAEKSHHASTQQRACNHESQTASVICAARIKEKVTGKQLDETGVDQDARGD
jgi:hypothetical protein